MHHQTKLGPTVSPCGLGFFSHVARLSGDAPAGAAFALVVRRTAATDLWTLGNACGRDHYLQWPQPTLRTDDGSGGEGVGVVVATMPQMMMMPRRCCIIEIL